VLPEQDDEKAIRIRDDFKQGIQDLISPDIFPIEVAQIVRPADSGSIQFIHESKQISQWEPEARQDVATGQGLLLCKRDVLGWRRVDSYTSGTRIDEPDQAAARNEVFTYFARHFSGRIALAQHFNRKIGSERKDWGASAAMVRQSSTANERQVGNPHEAGR